jgi:hypothetical protein
MLQVDSGRQEDNCSAPNRQSLIENAYVIQIIARYYLLVEVPNGKLKNHYSGTSASSVFTRY